MLLKIMRLIGVISVSGPRSSQPLPNSFHTKLLWSPSIFLFELVPGIRVGACQGWRGKMLARKVCMYCTTKYPSMKWSGIKLHSENELHLIFILNLLGWTCTIFFLNRSVLGFEFKAKSMTNLYELLRLSSLPLDFNKQSLRKWVAQ